MGQAEGREARGEQWGLKLSEKTAGRVWTWAGPYLKGKMVEVWYALQSEIPIKYRRGNWFRVTEGGKLFSHSGP